MYYQLDQALHAIAHTLLEHGSPLLFVLLALGIVGLPVPDETLLVAAGYLIAKGKFGIAPTLVAAYAGSLCGITISYGIGLTAGSFLVKNYGHWIGITEHRAERAHYWFNRIGVWSLLIGYFIPGVRHLTGYIAGTLQVSFYKFAIFAYVGAFLWASTFLLTGYLLAH